MLNKCLPSSEQHVSKAVLDNILDATTSLTNMVCHAYPWLSRHFCLRGQTTRVNSHFMRHAPTLNRALNLSVSTKSKSNDKKLVLVTRLRSSKPVAYKVNIIQYSRTNECRYNTDIFCDKRERGVFVLLTFQKIYVLQNLIIYKTIVKYKQLMRK